MKKIIVSIFAVTLLCNTACKKDEKEEPKPKDTTPDTPAVERPKVKEIYGIKLYNQALDTTMNSGKNFYNITEEKYGNSLTFPIELAFVHYQPSNNATKHLIGCARAERVRSNTIHGVPATNNTRTTFYVIDDGNSTLIFDTIQYSESVKTIFDKKSTLSVVDGENDAIQSDGFGWDKGEILGFELDNGKKGLIKLITAPTGSKDENGNISLGKIAFDIKMER